MSDCARLVDYFVVTGLAHTIKEGKERKAEILDRYPLEDYEDSPLPAEISMFCLPLGIQIVQKCELPYFFTFVLTGADGAKMYGCCLLFFEGYSSAEPWLLMEQNKDKELDEVKDTLYVNKSFCLLSHYPLISTFRAFLTQLYRIHLTPGKVPIERYIVNFVSEVPLPPRGLTRIRYDIPPEQIHIERSPQNELPSLDVPFKHLFISLSVQNILILFQAILSEQQILVHSKFFSLLGTVCHSLLSLIYPFVWHHVYIPVLPIQCTDFIGAPMPFIMGIHSSFLDQCRIPQEVIVVDLDRGILSNLQNIPLPKLPEKQTSKLRSTLAKLPIRESLKYRKLVNIDSAFNLAPIPSEIEDQSDVPEFPTEKIRFAFFRFFVSFFQKYRTYLDSKMMNTKEIDIAKLFKSAQFLADQRPSDKQFARMFVESQAFQQFICERYLSENSGDVLFFDESIDAKANRSKLKIYKKETPFLNDPSLKICKTNVALTPMTSDLPKDRIFSYQNFPRFKKENLYNPRKVEPLFTPAKSISQFLRVLDSWRSIRIHLGHLINVQKNRKKRVQKREETMLELARARSQNALRHQHTRSVSLSNMNYSEFESSLITDLSSAERTNHFSGYNTLFAGAPLYLQSLRMNDDEITTSNDGEDDEASSTFKSSVFTRFSFGDSEVCPQCNFQLMNRQIRVGWSDDPQDYRTTCPIPNCQKKFVPRFTVKVTYGKTETAVMYHEYLSPLLLQKEMQNLERSGTVADATLISNHPRIFWNFVIHFRDLKIPLNFLLPSIDWNVISERLEEIIKENEPKEPIKTATSIQQESGTPEKDEHIVDDFPQIVVHDNVESPQ